jgi:hypothetical protein
MPMGLFNLVVPELVNTADVWLRELPLSMNFQRTLGLTL